MTSQAAMDITNREIYYTNPAQFARIMERRAERKFLPFVHPTVSRKRGYTHESRHLQAVSRERGKHGRFLNTKSDGDNVPAAPKSVHPLPPPKPVNSCATAIFSAEEGKAAVDTAVEASSLSLSRVASESTSVTASQSADLSSGPTSYPSLEDILGGDLEFELEEYGYML